MLRPKAITFTWVCQLSGKVKYWYSTDRDRETDRWKRKRKRGRDGEKEEDRRRTGREWLAKADTEEG